MWVLPDILRNLKTTRGKNCAAAFLSYIACSLGFEDTDGVSSGVSCFPGDTLLNTTAILRIVPVKDVISAVLDCPVQTIAKTKPDLPILIEPQEDSAEVTLHVE
jgi:hypothetical protein